jgi:hypothetical protein
MKNFFSNMSKPFGVVSTSTTPPKRSTSQSTDLGMPEMLGKAEELLKRLRKATMQDFPLLNEATRLGVITPP